MSEVIVVGGGASGMIAAYAASLNGNHVKLIERNEKLGKKIYITGKGRCNYTNNCDVADIEISVRICFELVIVELHLFRQSFHQSR